MAKKFLNSLHHRKGQILPILAIGTAVFLGFAAISVDYGYLAWQKRELQNAADSGALAAAWELPNGLVTDKAQSYSNAIVPDSFKSAVKSTYGRMVTVTVERSYNRMFGNVFKVFDNSSASSDVISAVATARRNIPNLDLLPIADIDTYTRPGVANNARTEDTDPFYFYMQKMTLAEYYKFMMLRLRGGSDSGILNYERITKVKGVDVITPVTVNISYNFPVKSEASDPALAMPLGSVTISSSDEIVYTGTYDIPGNEIVFLEKSGNIKGNFGLLTLSAYSEGNNPPDVIIKRLNKPIYTEGVNSGSNIEVKPGTVSSIEDKNAIPGWEEKIGPLTKRLTEDGWRGFVLSVLPSKASELTGASLNLGWNDYLLLYVEDFNVNIEDPNKKLYGDIRGIFHLGKLGTSVPNAYPNMEDLINDIRVFLVK